jgi:Rrf2 family protein
MIQISRKVDYAVRLMVEVGSHADGALATTEVARRHDIPYEFLRKIAQTLVSKGLLISSRGGSGGLSLAREADTITVMDITSIFDAPYLNRCTVDSNQCELRDTCPVYPVWKEAQTALERIFGQAKLSDMIRRGGIIRGKAGSVAGQIVTSTAPVAEADNTE